MSDTRETILTVARATAQAHGYNGLSFRELAKTVGIKSASLHYHFPTKGDLGAELARRYHQDAAAAFADVSARVPDLSARLRAYAGIFRQALENGNRMCMCGFMAAEYDDLPDPVKAEVQAFADVNVEWLAGILAEADPAGDRAAHRRRAHAIFAAVGGAQLAARSRGTVSLYDQIIDDYCAAGLIPA